MQVLRNTLNCTLPIELVYNGEYEMDAKTCNKFEVRTAHSGSYVISSVLVLISVTRIAIATQSEISLMW